VTFAQTTSDESVRELSKLLMELRFKSKMTRGVLLPILG
jgi:hypothetical protein